MPSVRRIAGLSLGAILLCGAFFGLGYLIGTYLLPRAPSASAESSMGGQPGSRPASKPPQVPPQSGVTPPAQEASSALQRFAPPTISRGAFVIQVATLASEGAAFAVAEVLKKKGYPAFVVGPPTAGNTYRVSVGPYADADSADLAKRSLEREGFKPFVRRQRSRVRP